MEALKSDMIERRAKTAVPATSAPSRGRGDTRCCSLCREALVPGARFCDQCGQDTGATALGYALPAPEQLAELRKPPPVKDPSAHKIRALKAFYDPPHLHKKTSRANTVAGRRGRRVVPSGGGDDGGGGDDDEMTRRTRVIIEQHHIQASRQEDKAPRLQAMAASNTATFKAALSTVDERTDEVFTFTREHIRRAVDYRSIADAAAAWPREPCSALVCIDAGTTAGRAPQYEPQPQQHHQQQDEVRLRPQDIERRRLGPAARCPEQLDVSLSDHHHAAGPSPRGENVVLRREDIDRRTAWFWGSLKDQQKSVSVQPSGVYWGSACHGRPGGAGPESTDDDDHDDDNDGDGEYECHSKRGGGGGDALEEGTEKPLHERLLDAVIGGSPGGQAAATSVAAPQQPQGPEPQTPASLSGPAKDQPVTSVVIHEEDVKLSDVESAELDAKETHIFSDLAISRRGLEVALKAEAKMYEVLKDVTVGGAMKKCASALTVASAQQAVAKAAAILFRIEKVLTTPMSMKQRKTFKLRKLMADEQFQSANSVLAKAITEEARVGREHDRYRMKAALSAGEAHLDTKDRRHDTEVTAAICIQRIIRGFLGRAAAKHIRMIRLYQAKKAAAVVLQARARKILSRSRYKGNVMVLIRVQARVRKWLAGRQVRVLKQERLRMYVHDGGTGAAAKIGPYTPMKVTGRVLRKGGVYPWGQGVGCVHQV